jgi:hypothetical protein
LSGLGSAAEIFWMARARALGLLCLLVVWGKSTGDVLRLPWKDFWRWDVDYRPGRF